jgi:hypothetical protein
MKLYVAGPMSGLPWLNQPAFDQATTALREMGYVVISPAEKDREWGQDPDAARTGRNSLHMPDVMRWDLQQVLACDGIVLLPGWENSPGSRLERVVAESSGRLVFGWSMQSRLVELPPWDHEIIYKPGRRAATHPLVEGDV